MPSIDPREGQMKAALESVPAGVPVVMLNLLKFRAQAQYPDQSSPLTGKQAYNLYSKQAFAHVAGCGGEVLFWGKAHAAIIAPEGESWDEMLLVQYPSIEKFVAMVMNPDYQAIAVHRTAGLEDARLIATVKKG